MINGSKQGKDEGNLGDLRDNTLSGIRKKKKTLKTSKVGFMDKINK